VNLAGRWVGTWKGLGLFDSLRESAVEARLVQQGGIGVAHLYFDNTIAAGVPFVNDRLIGTLPSADSPVVITLTRAK
jgi:hypothetical protein